MINYVRCKNKEILTMTGFRNNFFVQGFLIDVVDEKDCVITYLIYARDKTDALVKAKNITSITLTDIYEKLPRLPCPIKETGIARPFWFAGRIYLLKDSL